MPVLHCACGVHTVTKSIELENRDYHRGIRTMCLDSDDYKNGLVNARFAIKKFYTPSHFEKHNSFICALTFATMTISGNLKTGTYTLRNASTNDFVVVQGPKTAALVTSNDGRAENAAWVLEKLSGHYDKYNIRNFAQNSYATVNTVQKRSAALTCGREVCPWSIRPTGYGTYVSVFHQLSLLRLI
ncbi:uncharacterized protein HD556DRAFT_1377753 [Suillus plorans]|uniref:Uncharacterized protein n=1 Tax=Suillus plorans TaxID=116603 RepID=A0A9P7DHD4_9AGAM|nr:uncharacterized protein HD556DRAFT_1377753 [Suillus plorans]KAG1792757.1 hypothetical protein HD556DRAFT_1377753 [Suillus plorans]